MRFPGSRGEVPLHLVEPPLAQIMLLEQAAEAAHRHLVRHRLAVKIDVSDRKIVARCPDVLCGLSAMHQHRASASRRQRNTTSEAAALSYP